MSLWTPDLSLEDESAIARHRGGLSNHIEAILARRILGGELPPGSTLPSQDDLVRQFGVSRAVVREAIAALELRGLLVVRHGRSTYVTAPTMWNVLDPFLVDIFVQLGAMRELLQDLFSVRLLIEPEAAAMVAMNHCPEHLAAVEESLERLELSVEAPTRSIVASADRDFHLRIALAAENQVLTTIVRSFQALLSAQFGITAFDQLPRVLSQHKAIYAAIAARDTESAREAMRLHLIDARDRFFRPTPPQEGASTKQEN